MYKNALTLVQSSVKAIFLKMFFICVDAVNPGIFTCCVVCMMKLGLLNRKS